ncbi:MAG: PadR family transcriptional regulator [Bacteroidales bacterium]|nr:PadR family transcriptional regulator [Bacteroidales bacterium]
MNKNIENNKAQMRKGVIELCILSLLSQEDMYVSDIVERLKEADLIIVEGTLYPLLMRLKNESLLTYRWEESKMGPPRKYYKIEPAGLAYLKELKDSWQELIESTKKIIN